jgi:Xaa-Pro aminopeptidase
VSEPVTLARPVALRAQAERHDATVRARLDRLVPTLMRREGLDAWVLVAREYAEDPVVRTMLPATWLSARRRTILVFLDDGDAVRRHAIARYAVGDLFPASWDPRVEPDQWAALAALLDAHDPDRIGIDVAPTWAHADGLTHQLHTELVAALPERLRERLVSAERLAVGWLETRLPEERDTYATACATAHELIRHVLSDATITPGVTTTTDVEWAFRQRALEAGLTAWFHPTVSVQRPGDGTGDSFAARPADTVIAPGDLVHIDAGIVLDDLCTDQQQHAYVLAAGETAPPAALADALATANRLQDLLLEQFVTGRTGNEMLAATLDRAAAEGIRATVYSHPIGLHGHGAGPTIGLWDQQDGVPGAGDHPVRPDTVYSIELNAAVDVDGWGTVRFMLEEETWFDGQRADWLDGRQTTLWVVGHG